MSFTDVRVQVPPRAPKKERQALPVSLFWYSVLCLQQRAALCRRVRPRLINDRMRREIFLLGKANIRRNTLCISKIFSAAQRKNIRCLGALTCFKQGLIEPLRGRAAEGFPLVPYTRVIGESLFMIKPDRPYSERTCANKYNKAVRRNIRSTHQPIEPNFHAKLEPAILAVPFHCSFL